jgi:hypothetical protein
MKRPTTTECMAASFLVALAIVLFVGVVAPPGNKVGIALRATARWSFLLFWLASVGGALAALFGSRFKALAERARDFGLSFASAHLAHLALVAWLLLNDPRQPIPILFVAGVFWTYLLALLSYRRFSAAFGQRIVRTLRTIGVEYISFIFLYDFLKNPFQGGVVNLIDYLPFQILAIAGPLLRLTALGKHLSQARRSAAA